MIKYIVLSFTFFISGFSLLSAQGQLTKAVEAFAKHPAMRHASYSIAVIDVKSGRLLEGKNAYQSLCPASSLKVITTTTALALLGQDYRFETQLQYDGELDASGTLKGNVYIKGSGDPTLGSDQMKGTADLATVFQQFVKALKEKGIKRIEGAVIGDASAFETAVAGKGWLWEDLGNYYGSGVWGLNVHENKYFLEFRQQSKLGVSPTIERIRPAIPNLLLLNEVKSAGKGSGDQAYIFGSPWNYTRFVRGTIPVGSGLFSVKGSMPDPPFFAAHYLTEQLNEAGIEVLGRPSSQLEMERVGASSKERTTFFTHQSPALKDIVKITNKKSVNLYCDAMLKALGLEEKGEGSSEAGVEVIRTYWEKKGLEAAGLFIEDGSGLSPRNAVSAYHLAKVMQLMVGDKDNYGSFYQSLPIAATDGTLKYLFRGTPVVGKLRAKSGGMERVRSYTGYTNDKEGKALAFCIIANNFTGKSQVIRKEMEKLMLAISQ